jgi:very-short-patch-repair endonuclease
VSSSQVLRSGKRAGVSSLQYLSSGCGELRIIPYFYFMLHQQRVNKELYLRVRKLARRMRKNPTAAEDFFWEKVRDRRLFGLKINRQYIIQCRITADYVKFYIADFHCYSLRLVIELDGQIHLRQQSKDLIRTEHLNKYGFTVIRFTNDQVLKKWDEVEAILRDYLRDYG